MGVCTQLFSLLPPWYTVLDPCLGNGAYHSGQLFYLN